MSAGYSGTPLVKKLGIKEGARVAYLRAPEGFADLVGPLPDGAERRDRARGDLDLVVAFTTARRDLEDRLPRWKQTMCSDGSLWVAWPKRASGVPTDVTEDVVREVGLANGLVDTKVCAIDETWSGLRLVVRLRDR